MRSTKALAPWVRKSEYIMISGWARRSFFADIKNNVSAGISESSTDDDGSENDNQHDLF